jgi:hypothetical protein
MTNNDELYRATLLKWSDIPLTIRFHVWHFWYGIKFRSRRLRSVFRTRFPL